MYFSLFRSWVILVSVNMKKSIMKLVFPIISYISVTKMILFNMSLSFSIGISIQPLSASSDFLSVKTSETKFCIVIIFQLLCDSNSDAAVPLRHQYSSFTFQKMKQRRNWNLCKPTKAFTFFIFCFLVFFLYSQELILVLTKSLESKEMDT